MIHRAGIFNSHRPRHAIRALRLSIHLASLLPLGYSDWNRSDAGIAPVRGQPVVLAARSGEAHEVGGWGKRSRRGSCGTTRGAIGVGAAPGWARAAAGRGALGGAGAATSTLRK